MLKLIYAPDPILKKDSVSLPQVDEHHRELIKQMYEIMYSANGVGLAAPQIGKSIRLFIIDATPFFEENNVTEFELNNLKRVFINPNLTVVEAESCNFNEGCLSIPEIREDIKRVDSIKIDFYDEKFNFQSLNFSGILARVILHEYDHIEGILFTDRISKFKKTLIQKKLNKISRGQIEVNYPMKFLKK